MGYRDELDAARERVSTLERDVAHLRRAAPAPSRPTDVAAALGVGLALTLVLSLVAITWLWNRAEDAEARARFVRAQLEAAREAQNRCEAEHTVTETVAVPSEVPGAREMLDRVAAWQRGDAVTESWTGTVVERIGEAPARIGQPCSGELRREATPLGPHTPSTCTLRLECGDHPVYPRPPDPGVVRCAIGLRAGIESLGAASADVLRARGSRYTMRLDDGPTGTWSLLIESADPPFP